MRNQPLISVIVPTFNDSSDRLNNTLQSILNQTYNNLEIIVADDGSSIPFGGLEQQLTDERLTWVNTVHGGVASTRNAGAKRASGEYLAFLDSGDWWEKDKLSKQYELFLRDSNILMVYCSVVTHDPYGRTAKIIASKEGDLYRELLVGQPIVGSCSAVLLSAKLFKDLSGFYEHKDIPEDQEFWLRVSMKGKISFVVDALVHLEIDLSSRSADPEAKMEPYQHFLNMYSKELSTEGLKDVAWSNYYVAIADKYFSNGIFGKGMRNIFSSLKIKPTKAAFIRLFAGCFSLFGSNAYLFTKYLYRKNG